MASKRRVIAGPPGEQGGRGGEDRHRSPRSAPPACPCRRRRRAARGLAAPPSVPITAPTMPATAPSTRKPPAAPNTAPSVNGGGGGGGGDRAARRCGHRTEQAPFGWGGRQLVGDQLGRSAAGVGTPRRPGIAAERRARCRRGRPGRDARPSSTAAGAVIVRRPATMPISKAKRIVMPPPRAGLQPAVPSIAQIRRGVEYQEGSGRRRHRPRYGNAPASRDARRSSKRRRRAASHRRMPAMLLPVMPPAPCFGWKF